MNENKLILVVDDDQDFRHATELLLQANGYRVVTAMDAEEALEKARAETPDLILLDVIMEEVDAGLVFAEKFGQTYPIVLISSIADSAVRVFDAHKLPVRGILQKPVKPEALLEKVRAVLQA